MKKISLLVIIFLVLIGQIFAQKLMITNPNGGEEYVAGNKCPIHWDWTEPISSVKLEYSIDGGTNWSIIASSTSNDGDYLWTIPNSAISSNCFIRISNVAHPDTNDISDGSFVVQRQSINIKKPNGNDTLIIGEYYPILWDWTGNFSNVKIEYSIDGGSSWNSIISSTTNDGDHYWLIPNQPSHNCRIKITNTNDPDCFKISDADFTIANNTIALVKPNGGESYTTGQIYPIYWDWTGNFSNVKIDYSIDGGNSWNSIINSTTNDGSYKWTIPNSPSTNCYLRIANTADPTCYDISADSFTITSTGLDLKSPNGGKTYVVGDKCPILWDWTGTISSVKIEYTTDNGTTWNPIINSTTNDGDYLWTIPNSPSGQCKVRITNLNDPNCSDESNTDFTIQAPSFKIVDPDSTQSLVAGEVYPIHWNWRGSVSSVKLELWYKIAATVQWLTIASNASNTGSYYFTVPYSISDSCGIKITSNNDPNCYNLSSVFKIIRPTIKVVYPNGGENLKEGDSTEIIWNANGNFSNVMLQYSVVGGNNWQLIKSSTPNDGSYEWIVPSGVWDTCKIKVTNTADIDCYDVSDSAFNILDGTIQIKRPIANDTFFIKNKHVISWDWTGGFPNVNISYSPDGGTSWKGIKSSAPNNGYYVWQCDTLTSSNAIIKVTSNQNGSVRSISTPFVIADTSDTSSLPALRILAPLNGDTFFIGNKYDITWHSKNFTSPNQVNISYSTDNGPWINIAKVSNSQHYYLWTIPNYITDNCRILVSDVNGTASDVSDSFSLVKQKIHILSPSHIKKWIVGRKYFIIWKTLGNFDHAVIDYSYNGGVDWYSIVSPTNNNGSYEWTIPNTPSPNCLVRIRNYENSSVEAISDTFTIEPQSINMSYPIQSDSFVIGRKYYITWDYSGAFSSVNIEYSIDGGANWTAITSSPVTNNQRYLWTIPDAPGNQTLVRVINSANLNVIGVSDTFSIIPQKITVISPDSNDEFTIGRKYYINWWNTGVFSKSRIEYSYDYENSWNTIVDNVSNSGSYEWTIPNTPSDSCFIKVSNHDNPSISGISPLFRIPLQTIEITSPSSIDTLISGRKYYITWKWNGTFSKVDIQFSVDNGATWSYIANNASNNGNYEWTIPTVNSGNCLVKISNTQNAAVYNISNKFAILPQQITITSPNANDTLLAGRKYYITWRTKGIFNQANIWYSLNGGQDWNVMATNVTNNGYYEWQLPESPSQNVNIKIGNSSQPSVFAISDTFQISPPILTFISPVAGNQWYEGRKYYIAWTCLGTIQNVNLFYSMDGGVNWDQIIANSSNQGYYEWTIPSNASSSANCRIKLMSSANSSISYISDSFGIPIYGIKQLSFGRIPNTFKLQMLSQNPLMKNGKISLALPSNSNVDIIIYNESGRIIHKVFDGNLTEGYHTFDINGEKLAKGTYFLKCEARHNNKAVFKKTLKLLKI